MSCGFPGLKSCVSLIEQLQNAACSGALAPSALYIKNMHTHDKVEIRCLHVAFQAGNSFASRQ